MAKRARTRSDISKSQVQHLYDLKKEIEVLQAEYKLLADELKDKADELGINVFDGITVDAVINNKTELEVNRKKALAFVLSLPKPENYLKLELNKVRKDFGESSLSSFVREVVGASVLRWVDKES